MSHFSCDSLSEFPPRMRIGLNQRYEIVRPCGRGGMGIVYQAVEHGLDRPRDVALKQLSKHLSQNPRFVDSVKREAGIARELRHPNIVGVYDYFQWQDEHLVVMEWIDGPTLDQNLYDRPDKKFALERTLEILQPVAAALDYAHRQTPQVVHRDLKPLNIMLNAKGEIKITDFGLSREVKESVTKITGRETSGSLEYMPYEQSMGEPPHPSQDIYALGICAYEFLHGEPPFCRGDIVLQHKEKEPPAIEGVPRPVMEVIRRALAKDSEERYSSAGEFYQALKVAYEKSLLPICPVCNQQTDVPRFTCTECGREDICNTHLAETNTCGECSERIRLDKQKADEERRKGLEEKERRDAEERLKAEKEKRKELEEKARREAEEKRKKELQEIERKKAEELAKEKAVEAERPVPEKSHVLPPKSDPPPTEKTGSPAPSAPKRSRNFLWLIAVAAIIIALINFQPWQRDQEMEPQQTNKVEQKIEHIEPVPRTSLKEKQILTLLSKADKCLAEDKLTLPADENAYEYYQEILKLDSENQRAKSGMQRIADRYNNLGDTQKSESDWLSAIYYYKKVIEIGGSDSGISQKIAQCREEMNKPKTPTPGSLIGGPLPGMKFAHIPGGSFMMGSNHGERDERPVHEVTLKPFFMMTTEVTQAMWVEIMGNNPSHYKGEDRPVERVSWNDCQEFIRKINQKYPGKNYRLPSESEWEYACRAGTTTKYCNGNNESDLERVGWYGGNSGGKTHPVGQKSPNNWDLYDMHGNVWEYCEDWCEDWNRNNYIGAPTDGNARLSPSATHRVRRGGHYFSISLICTSANRDRNFPDNHWGFNGFRLVHSP